MIHEKWGWNKEQMYDPCPAGIPYKAPCFFNGLYGDWWDTNYINPMYETKTLTKFVQKAHEQSFKGKASIMLLPVKTDQSWFHDIILKNAYQILWIRKRVKFKNDKDSSMSSHFLVLVQ